MMEVASTVEQFLQANIVQGALYGGETRDAFFALLSEAFANVSMREAGVLAQSLLGVFDTYFTDQDDAHFWARRIIQVMDDVQIEQQLGQEAKLNRQISEWLQGNP